MNFMDVLEKVENLCRDSSERDCREMTSMIWNVPRLLDNDLQLRYPLVCEYAGFMWGQKGG